MVIAVRSISPAARIPFAGALIGHQERGSRVSACWPAMTRSGRPRWKPADGIGEPVLRVTSAARRVPRRYAAEMAGTADADDHAVESTLSTWSSITADTDDEPTR